MKQIDVEIKKNQIKSFFEKNFNKLVLWNQLIPKSEIIKIWPDFIKWYNLLTQNNNFYTVENLKKEYNLLKDSSKRRYFFLKNYSILVKNKTLIPYTEIKSLGPEFYSWYCNMQITSSWNYSLKDLIKEFNIEIPYLKPKSVKEIKKEHLKSFFEKNKNILVVDWHLKSQSQIQKLGSEFVNWIRYMTWKKDGYSFELLFKEYNIKPYELPEKTKEELLMQITKTFKENSKFWLVCGVLPWFPFLSKKLTGEQLILYKQWYNKIIRLKKLDSSFEYWKFIKKMWYITASSANTSFHN